MDSEEKIATNILADRLALLECAGLISRHKHPDSKTKVLYKPTLKAADLIPALAEIIAWSDRHYKVHPYATEFSKQLKKDRAGLIRMLTEELKRSIEGK
jgi:DNA-binding HxlR family transcriptional regulator